MNPPLVHLSLQTLYESVHTPTGACIQKWIEKTLSYMHPIQPCLVEKPMTMTVRIVDKKEIQSLNKDYREKDKPTNVLSFPSTLPAFLIDSLEEHPLGDILICAPVVEEEANAQDKMIAHHWAHMIVHSILHLLGYDHVKPEEGERMESYEQAILAELGLPNPYRPNLQEFP